MVFNIDTPSVSEREGNGQVYIGSAVGSVLITALTLSITMVIICIIKKRNQYKLQAEYYTTAVPLYAEIQEPLYEVVHAETEHTTERLTFSSDGEDHQYDQTNEDVTEIPPEFEVSHSYVGDPENPGEVASTDVKRDHQVKIFDICRSAGVYERAQVYEQVLNMQLFSVGAHERAQVYERVPNVNISQLLSIVGVYERAQVYERVPNVNISQLLSIVGVYERAQVYERVPNVNIPQLLSIAGDLEQVPDIMLSQVANNGNYENSQQMSAYERVRYDEMTMQLIRGVMQPYEQISGHHERAHYSETMEQTWRTPGEEPMELMGAYERVRYSEEAMQLLRRMPRAVVCADTELNSDECGGVPHGEHMEPILRSSEGISTEGSMHHLGYTIIDSLL